MSAIDVAESNRETFWGGGGSLGTTGSYVENCGNAFGPRMGAEASRPCHRFGVRVFWLAGHTPCGVPIIAKICSGDPYAHRVNFGKLEPFHRPPPHLLLRLSSIHLQFHSFYGSDHKESPPLRNSRATFGRGLAFTFQP